MSTTNLTIITLFPEMFECLQYGIVGRAQTNKIINVHLIQLRDFSDNKHQRIDDNAYGGGPGMVMQYEPLKKAVEHAKENMPLNTKVIYLSPQGKHIHQAFLQEQAIANQHLIFICGRYEGVDQRFIDHHVDEEWSVGDYVLSGGEIPAMVVVDAITRLLPGALGHDESAAQDSFSEGLLDHPHYTRPEVVDDHKVPDVLLNGNHGAIEQWRLQQRLGQTYLKRPDLLKQHTLSDQEQQLLDDFLSKK